MKKIVAIILCVCIMFTACSRTPKEGKDEKASTEQVNEDEKQGTDEDNITDKGEDINVEPVELITLKLNKEWSGVVTTGKEIPELTIPEVEASVEPYTISKDLTNVENIEQFSGFTKEQINMLTENGFVVMPTTRTNMYYSYDDNEYKSVPNFITADSVLHTYHQFYDKSLTSIEVGFLYEDLELMTKQMLEQSILLLKELTEEDLKTLQEKNIVFFLVAEMLMENTPDIQTNASQEQIALAKQEYTLINAAEGYEVSPLLDFKFDYSQFTVRGHYTRSEELGRFFKTMMWYGTAPFALMNKDDEKLYANTLQALLMTYTTFSDYEGSCAAEFWQNIYLPTSQYVGVSDDIDVFTMNMLRIGVYGGAEDPNQYNDEEYYDKLSEAVKELPEPQIVADFVELDTPTAKQFRFMGQRYILDSDILQELIDPDLRPIPSALDVMGVLGNDTAEELLFEEYRPQDIWPEYEIKYQTLEKLISGYTIDKWGSNLYNGWLWAIQAELKEYDYASGMPYFMTNKAWKYKSLNAALGSYTELKHDTVLYGKQSSAEGGGPLDFAIGHYVEPNIELYTKLLYLTDNTIAVLEERGMMNESLTEGATRYKELLELLISCSIKELNNEVLTEEENDSLLGYGGRIEHISELFLHSMTDDYASKDISDMLVTDISTYMDTYLSLGTGFFDDIYVVVPIDGELFLSRGSVYSSYEFNSDKRLTDEEWWALNGIKIIKEDYTDYAEFTEPSENMPEQPFWVKPFKSDTNNVEIVEKEVDWDILVE